MAILQSLLILLARLCICSLYLWAGSAKIIHWKGTVDYMKSKNFPLPALTLPAAIIVQFIGGISVGLGYYTRIGAIILIAFTIIATIKMHNFWSVSPEMKTAEKTFFMKDVAIIGGLLFLLVFGPGLFSLDHLLKTLCQN